LLGYGGTSKPTETEAYKFSLITKDIIDILDAESIAEAIVIGHDWGSKLTSRLYNYYPDRFKAYGFLSLCYLPPDPNFDVEKASAMVQSMLGYDVFGYQLFFSEDGAEQVILDHVRLLSVLTLSCDILLVFQVDTFFEILWTEDPKIWIQHLAPRGVLKDALLNDLRFPTGPWLSDEVRFTFFWSKTWRCSRTGNSSKKTCARMCSRVD
jgi:pimeloyl-ACP methyl ester carboxylesterase